MTTTSIRAKAMPSRQAVEGRSKPTEEQSDRIVRVISAVVVTSAVTFFSVVTTISYFDPTFFHRMLVAHIGTGDIDPMTVGSTTKPSEGPSVEPIPAPRIVRAHALEPADFSIVMVFGDEAHLASPGEIWRIKEGMIVPGLGKILAIENGEKGGTIKTENAVLTAVPQ